MVTEEVLENETVDVLYAPEGKQKAKKKGRIKKFFSNEDVILTLFSLGASTIILILMLVAGAVGASFPTNGWWF